MLNLAWEREWIEQGLNPKAELEFGSSPRAVWCRCSTRCHSNNAEPEPGAVPSSCTRARGPAGEAAPPAGHPRQPPGPLGWIFLCFFPDKPRNFPALIPLRELCPALPRSLWRHFSALLRDVYKVPLFLFIGGPGKPFPGRAGALCAWHRGELSLCSGACSPCPNPAEREIPDLEIAF